MIGVICRVHDHVLGVCQPLDQSPGLRAVAPLARRDCEPDRQAKRVNSGMDFRGQAAFGAANSGSFKPPF